MAAGAVFGYLDHPFSARYQYGWSDEATRVAAHRHLIEHINRGGDVWWASINDLLDFLKRRDVTCVSLDDAGQLCIEGCQDSCGPPIAVRWKGQDHVA